MRIGVNFHFLKDQFKPTLINIPH